MNKSRHAYTLIAYFFALFFIASKAVDAANNYSMTSEKQLLQTLRTGAPAEKAIACKQLAIYSSKAAVPDLAKLLGDDHLASWSRIALEAIPDPSADAALIQAAKTLKGQLLVGTINSIGVRRSAGAVELLTERLKNGDAEVASASAVALGKIGSDQAAEALRRSLAGASPAVRSAVAEGCILCAEQLLAKGKNDRAAEIYDQVRKADVPKQRVLEATRGAIVARGAQGVPLLVEQLKSPDRKRFALGLMLAHELRGQEVADALTTELVEAAPARAALIVLALGDRGDAELPPAVLEAARSGNEQVRLAAIQVVGRLGDSSTVSTLLKIAVDDDAELSQAAKDALASLPGKDVNATLAARLSEAKGKELAALIELVGQRRIEAVTELEKALNHADGATRDAALVALGATVGPKDLKVLISEVTGAKNEADLAAAERALQSACIRMPDREATAAELAADMATSTSAKASLLRILGAMGGPTSLQTIAAAVKTGDPELQDVGTQALGEWMTADAAPVLLEIAKSGAPDKYKVLRGAGISSHRTPNENVRCQAARNVSSGVGSGEAPGRTGIGVGCSQAVSLDRVGPTREFIFRRSADASSCSGNSDFHSGEDQG